MSRKVPSQLCNAVVGPDRNIDSYGSFRAGVFSFSEDAGLEWKRIKEIEGRVYSISFNDSSSPHIERQYTI